MSTYAAPVRDMTFLLTRVLDVPALPDAADLDAQMIETVLNEAGRLASEELAPLNRTGDEQGCTLDGDGNVTTPKGFKEAYATYRDNGWNGVPFASDYGGQGLPWTLAFAIQEMWQGANLSFGLCPLLNQGAVEAIEHHGTEDQKNIYLEKLVTGEWTGTMNLTEPQAGSDLGILKTKAVPQDDGTYKITGQKIYITYGEHDFSENIIHLVLARTPDAPEGTDGISLFIVPKFIPEENGAPGARNDAYCTKLEHKPGIHASPTCVMYFGDNSDGATGYLVGEENGGLRCMFTMMNNARLSVGLQGVAVAEHACQQALAYAKERLQGTALGDKSGKRIAIIDHPDVRRMLLSMKARIEAARALTYEAAKQLDLSRGGDDNAQERVDLLTPVVKAWCTDMAVDVTSTGMQVHGGMGYVEETGAAQYWRDARILPIYEGTNGIQAMDLVFRKIIKDEGKAASRWVDEAHELLNKMEKEDKLGGMAAALRESLGTLDEAVKRILKRGAESPDRAAAVCMPFLTAFGTIAGGVMMGRKALVALDLDDSAHAEAILATSRFYMSHILPHSISVLETVTDGARAVTEVSDSVL